MTPSQWLLEDTRAWVRRAERDLGLARLGAAAFPAEALFHCQQAAEKYLKAYLTWRQTPFRKTHELRQLAGACIRLDGSLASVREPSEALSKYAWRFRYPGAPYEPDTTEAAKGLEWAEKVRHEISARLPT